MRVDIALKIGNNNSNVSYFPVMRTLSNPDVRWDGFVEFDDRPYFLTIMKFYLIYPFSFFSLYSSPGGNDSKI